MLIPLQEKLMGVLKKSLRPLLKKTLKRIIQVLILQERIIQV